MKSSRKSDAINAIVLLDFPSDLSVKLVQVIKDHEFGTVACDNCAGSGISKVTDRLCTKCNGEGEISA